MVQLQNGTPEVKQFFFDQYIRGQILTHEIYNATGSINGFNTLTKKANTITISISQTSLQCVWGLIVKSDDQYVCSADSWVVIIGNVAFAFREKTKANTLYKLFAGTIHIDLKTVNDIYYRLLYGNSAYA